MQLELEPVRQKRLHHFPHLGVRSRPPGLGDDVESIRVEPIRTDTFGSPSFSTGKLNLTGKGATIAQLISFLSREMRLPIVDETGLNGRYDYFMDINAYITDETRSQSGPRWKRRAPSPMLCRGSSA